MKKIIVIFVLVFYFGQGLKAQFARDYKPAKHENKYFLSLAYGIGQARWYSSVNNTELYDPNGAVVRDGNFKFNARNHTRLFNAEVLIPVAKVRLGVGMNFENYDLDKLDLKNGGNASSLYPFNESFRMDKITGILEYPFSCLEKTPFTLNLQAKMGYIGFTKVNSVNLFGGATVPKTFFVASGLVMDYEIVKRIYVFASPMVSYNYCRTSKYELPVTIMHRIITGNFLIGVRLNVCDR